MIKTPRLLPLCAAIATATLTSQSAMAGMATDFGNFTDDSGSAATAAVALDRFDGSLGVLTDVMITINSEYSVSGDISYDGPEGFIYTHSGSTSHSGDILGVPGLGAQNFFFSTQNPSCTVPSTGFRNNIVNCAMPDNSGGVLSGDLETLLAVTLDPSDFLGAPGSTFLLNFGALAQVDDCDAGNPNSVCSASTSWGGGVEVKYTYSEHVPLPAPLVLLGVGLVGLGFSQQRRKRLGG